MNDSDIDNLLGVKGVNSSMRKEKEKEKNMSDSDMITFNKIQGFQKDDSNEFEPHFFSGDSKIKINDSLNNNPASFNKNGTVFSIHGNDEKKEDDKTISLTIGGKVIN